MGVTPIVGLEKINIPRRKVYPSMQSSLEQEMPDLPLHAHGDWNIFLHTGSWPLHQPAGNYEVVSKRISARVISSQKNG